MVKPAPVAGTGAQHVVFIQFPQHQIADRRFKGNRENGVVPGILAIFRDQPKLADGVEGLAGKLAGMGAGYVAYQNIAFS